MKQDALLLEKVSVKNKTCIVDERRDSSNYKNIVLRIFLGFKRIGIMYKKVSAKDEIIFVWVYLFLSSACKLVKSEKFHSLTNSTNFVREEIHDRHPDCVFAASRDVTFTLGDTVRSILRNNSLSLSLFPFFFSRHVTD